jgi:hypothetical protein
VGRKDFRVVIGDWRLVIADFRAGARVEQFLARSVMRCRTSSRVTDNSFRAHPCFCHTSPHSPAKKKTDVYRFAMREPAMLCRLPSPQRRQALPVSAGTGTRGAASAVRVAMRSLPQELYGRLARRQGRALTDAALVYVRRSRRLKSDRLHRKLKFQSAEIRKRWPPKNGASAKILHL